MLCWSNVAPSPHPALPTATTPPCPTPRPGRNGRPPHRQTVRQTAPPPPLPTRHARPNWLARGGPCSPQTSTACCNPTATPPGRCAPARPWAACWTARPFPPPTTGSPRWSSTWSPANSCRANWACWNARRAHPPQARQTPTDGTPWPCARWSPSVPTGSPCWPTCTPRTTATGPLARTYTRLPSSGWGSPQRRTPACWPAPRWTTPCATPRAWGRARAWCWRAACRRCTAKTPGSNSRPTPARPACCGRAKDASTVPTAGPTSPWKRATPWCGCTRPPPACPAWTCSAIPCRSATARRWNCCPDPACGGWKRWAARCCSSPRPPAWWTWPMGR